MAPERDDWSRPARPKGLSSGRGAGAEATLPLPAYQRLALVGVRKPLNGV